MYVCVYIVGIVALFDAMIDFMHVFYWVQFLSHTSPVPIKDAVHREKERLR